MIEDHKVVLNFYITRYTLSASESASRKILQHNFIILYGG